MKKKSETNSKYRIFYKTPSKESSKPSMSLKSEKKLKNSTVKRRHRDREVAKW